MALLHTGSRFLGRLPDGSRVVASLTVTEHVRSTMNHRHEPLGHYIALRFSGYATKLTKRAAWTYQIPPLITEIVIPGKGLTLDDLRLLSRLWKEWDRNDLQDGCGEPGCPGELRTVAVPGPEPLVQIVSFFPRCNS